MTAAERSDVGVWFTRRALHRMLHASVSVADAYVTLSDPTSVEAADPLLRLPRTARVYRRGTMTLIVDEGCGTVLTVTTDAPDPGAERAPLDLAQRRRIYDLLSRRTPLTWVPDPSRIDDAVASQRREEQ